MLVIIMLVWHTEILREIKIILKVVLVHML